MFVLCILYSTQLYAWHEHILILTPGKQALHTHFPVTVEVRFLGTDNRRAGLKIETDDVPSAIWKRRLNVWRIILCCWTFVSNCSSLLDFKMRAPKSLLWGPLKRTFMFPHRDSPKQPLNQGFVSTVLSGIQPGSTISPPPPGSDIPWSSQVSMLIAVVLFLWWEASEWTF